MKDIWNKRVGSDRQAVWILFAFGAVLSLAGLLLFLSLGGDDGDKRAKEIIIREVPDKPPPPPGEGGYALAPAQVEREAEKGKDIYIASAQNRSGGKVRASVRFLPITRQARSGEALYADNPKTAALGEQIIRLEPREKELANDEVLRIRGEILQERGPAAYGLLTVTFAKSDSQPFSISSFVTLRFPGDKKGDARGTRLLAREEDGAVRFFLSSKNRGNFLVNPTVLFRVLQNEKVIWEERVTGQGILPGMTRDIASSPVKVDEKTSLRAEAKILAGGSGNESSSLLYKNGKLLFEDGDLTPRGVVGKNLLLEIENKGTESFEPRAVVSLLLPGDKLLSLEKDFPSLAPGEKEESKLALPAIRQGRYNVLYTLQSTGGLVLDERDGILEIERTIRRPSFLEQGYLPMPLLLGLLVGLLLLVIALAAVFFYSKNNQGKEQE